MPRRLLALIACALPLLLSTGCAESETAARAAGPTTPFDRALHDALPEDVRSSGELRVAATSATT
jgi:hypothetical protein